MSFEIKTIFEYYSVSYFTKYLSKCFLEFSDVAALTYYSNMHLIGIFCIKDMRHDMIFDHVMIIVIGGFLKNLFLWILFLFPRNSFE